MVWSLMKWHINPKKSYLKLQFIRIRNCLASSPGRISWVHLRELAESKDGLMFGFNSLFQMYLCKTGV